MKRIAKSRGFIIAEPLVTEKKDETNRNDSKPANIKRIKFKNFNFWIISGFLIDE